METINKCQPWKKGKLVGQKPPLKPKDIWAIRFYLQNHMRFATLPCSTWPSTASCEAAISSVCEYATLPMVAKFSLGPWSPRARHSGQNSSN